MGLRFIDIEGTFFQENPDQYRELYFPLAGESGIKSCVSPLLGGDSKLDQNAFLMEPVSIEDLRSSNNTRNFWFIINDQVVWSATGMSAWQQSQQHTDEKEKTSLKAGMLWYQLHRYNEKLGIASEITMFVPAGKMKAELLRVVVKNKGMERIKIRPVSAIPVYGRSADNIRDHRHVTSLLHRIRVEENGIMVKPTLSFDERGHKQNEMIYGVFGKASNGNLPEGFYPTVAEFAGISGTLECPDVLYKGCINQKTAGYETAGEEALGGIVFSEQYLDAGEEAVFYLSLQYGKDSEKMKQEAEVLLSDSGYQEQFTQVQEFWRKKLPIFCGTGNKDFDAWIKWVEIQPVLRRIYGCSFLPHHDYGRGGRGWRDLWQDCLSLLLTEPEEVKEVLFQNFGGVRMDGTNATIIGTNPGEFIADRNNIVRVWMDHGVWPFMTIHLYLQQTGDLAFLLKETTFFKDGQSHRGDKRDEDWNPSEGNLQKTIQGDVYYSSILEHLLLQALTAFYDVGEHNHIRLRGADWNDALDMAVERGESVAFTAAYAGNLDDFASVLEALQEKEHISEIALSEEMMILLEEKKEIYDDVNKKLQLLRQYENYVAHVVSGMKQTISVCKLAKNLRGKAAWIKEHIRNSEFVRDSKGYAWFNGYYDNYGRQVEGEKTDCIHMMLTSQVFTVLSGTADSSQTKQIIQAVDSYLYEPSMGGYRLNTDFREVRTDLGRMTGFAFGHKENGAVFSHMDIMYAYALYSRNEVRAGYKVVQNIFRHCMDFEKSRIYPGIPEYFGPDGVGRYQYLTGAASWFMMLLVNEIFGIKGAYGDLILDPKLEADQFDGEGKASINLRFAGKDFQVVYMNENRKTYGTYRNVECFLDGKELKEGIITKEELQELDKQIVHTIIVRLG